MISKEVSFGKAQRCLSVSNGIIELVVSLDFGPRILFYGFQGGQNFFQVFDDQIENIKEDEWRIYGGHRLWLAPEEKPKSYYPDNAPVDYVWNENVLRLTAPIEKDTGVQKIIEIQLQDNSSEVRVNHRIINCNKSDMEFSVWALSVMNAGGRVVIPHEQYISHDDWIAPARPLVLWHFTDMSDPRFVWGKKHIQMSQDNTYNGKLKIGVLNKKACEAYILNDEVFIKKHSYIENETYPDMGCNAEFFTMPNFLEVESLSPLKRVSSQNEIQHEEVWSLKKMKIEKNTSEDKLDEIFV